MARNIQTRNILRPRIPTGGTMKDLYPNKTIANIPENQIKEMHKIKPKHATPQKHYKQYVKLSKKYAKKPNKETLNQAMSHYIKAHTPNTNIHTHNLKTKPAGQK